MTVLSALVSASLLFVLMELSIWPPSQQPPWLLLKGQNQARGQIVDAGTGKTASCRCAHACLMQGQVRLGPAPPSFVGICLHCCTPGVVVAAVLLPACVVAAVGALLVAALLPVVGGVVEEEPVFQK